MDLNWLECLFVGLVAGLADVLPVSSQAHKAIFLKIFGANAEPPLLRFVIHLAIFGTLYYCCYNHLRRLWRQLKLSRVPKKKRKRPVDSRTIAEFKVLRIMAVPIVLSFFLYSKTSGWGNRLNLVAIFLLLNGIILYLPRLMPTGNKDALSLSALDGLFVGLGSVASVLPGVSSVGTMLSLASICGTERQFALSLTYLGHLVIMVGILVMDLVQVVTGNVAYNLPVLISCAVAGIAAAIGTYVGVKFMRLIAANSSFTVFAFYSFGAALFSFIIYLLV